MSKSSVLDQKAKQYILDCINLSVYDETAQTAQQAAQKVVSFIMNEADYEYNRKKLITDQAIIADHIMGLPSYFEVEYRYFQIVEMAVLWGSLPENYTDKQKQKICDNWPLFIASKLLQIANGYHIKGLTYEQ